MKSKVLAGVLALSTVLTATTVKAANPDHVQRLLNTRECAGCNLSGADLKGAYLLGADLRNANLRGANLSDANLEGADLTGANLRGANLTRAFVTNATLNKANLTNADFRYAKVYNAETIGTIWTNVNIAGAEVFGSNVNIGSDQ